jgi:N-acetylglutamate synthase-like GNAT family acetyltransferase
MDPNRSSAIRIAQVEEILDLRHRVLRAGLPRQSARFVGDESAAAVHLAVEERSNVIGCATLHPSDWEGEPAYQLRGMAVDPAFQRQGIGSQILLEIDRITRESPRKILWANCRTPAIPFYLKHGWRAVSEEFEIPTAGPHRKMVRHL